MTMTMHICVIFASSRVLPMMHRLCNAALHHMGSTQTELGKKYEEVAPSTLTLSEYELKKMVERLHTSQKGVVDDHANKVRVGTFSMGHCPRSQGWGNY